MVFLPIPDRPDEQGVAKGTDTEGRNVSFLPKMAGIATEVIAEHTITPIVNIYFGHDPKEGLPGKLAGQVAAKVLGFAVTSAVECLGEAARQDDKTSGFARSILDSIERREYDRALRELEDAIASSPDAAWAHYVRGLVHLHESWASDPKWEGESLSHAEADMATARRLRPGDRRIDFAAGYIAATYAMRSDRDFRSEGDFDRAIRDIARSLEWAPGIEEHIQGFPSEETAHRTRGIACLTKEDPARAIHEANRLLRIRPTDPSGLFIRGVAFATRNRLDPAIADLSEALRLRPGSSVIRDVLVPAYRLRGESYMQKRDFDRAISDLDEAVRLEGASKAETMP